MKRALEMLGYDPCYHMYEVMLLPERIQMWREIAFGHIDPDWDAVFGGYHATVDWPAATYWRELAVRYPDAKILLTRRDSESWYRSMEKTILQVIARTEDGTSVSYPLLTVKTFGHDLSKDNLIRTYEAHNAQFQASFGPDRLLTYELGSGWEPLCTFLDCPIPDAPYPRGNDPHSSTPSPGIRPKTADQRFTQPVLWGLALGFAKLDVRKLML